MSSRITPARIALAYGLLAGLYILGSAWLMGVLVADVMLRPTIEVLKGLAFVAITSALLYLLLRAWHQALQRAFEEQHQGDALLRFHLQNSPLALIEWDAQFRIRHWSARAEAIFGWQAGEVLGRHPTDWSLVYPEDMPKVHLLMEELLRGHLPRNQNVNRNLTKAGAVRWCEWYNSVRVDAEGRLQSILSLVQDITERKAAEAALVESESRYRSLFENKHAVMLIIDPADGAIVDANPAAAKFYGWSRPTLRGMRITDINVLPAEPSKQATAAAKAARRGHFVFRHRRADGSIRDVDVYSGRIVIAGRELLYSIVHDSTRQREAERAVSLMARRAEGLLSLPGAAERLDEAAFMQYGQELAENLTGSRIAFIHFVHQDEENIELVTWSGRTLREYCTAAYDSHYPVRTAGIWADALRRRAPVVFNDYAHHPDKRGLPPGHSPLSRLISVPVMEQGRVVMLSGVGNKDSDYTEQDVETVQLISGTIWHLVQRRRGEARLRQLSLAVEQSPDSIVITNLDAQIEYVNEAFLRTTGYTRDQVRGQNPRILKSGRTPASHYQDMWAALTTGQTWQGEFYNRRRDGSEYVEYGHVAPLRAPDGAITHYVAVKQDITGRKRIEEELNRHRHHLEDLVGQRTSELAEARQQAESANQAKSAFLANMSHEIRTPLNGVLGMVELLGRTPLTADQNEMLDTIRESGTALTRLIDDILDFSKIEAGHMALEEAPVDLRHLLAGLCASLRPVAAEQAVDLECEVAAELPAWVVGDQVRLRQVLYNLLGNGIKFSRGGAERRGRVTARAGPGAGSDSLRLTVSDNGIGMSAETQSQLFMPFTQGEVATTRRFGGTGLGLSICRRLVDLMGGRISVDSRPGQGATFVVTLPLRPVDAAQAAAMRPLPTVTPMPPAAADGAPVPRVLVAEDDEINRRVVLRQLELLGFQADLAGNGNEALRLWRTGGYALVLTDLHMPDLDGYALTEQIRREEAARGDPPPQRTPILALTANALRGEAERARDLGMDDYLTKPLALETLRVALARWVSARAPAPQPAAKAPPAPDQVFDVATLRRLVGQDEEGLRSLLAEYLASARRLRGDIQVACEAGQPRAVAAAAHKLKAASRSVGALPLATLCRRLEAAGEEGSMPLVLSLRAPFEAALIAVEREVRGFLARPGASD